MSAPMLYFRPKDRVYVKTSGGKYITGIVADYKLHVAWFESDHYHYLVVPENLLYDPMVLHDEEIWRCF